MSKIAFLSPSQDFEQIYGGFSEEASVLPPLGLCYLATAMKSIGHDVKIIDSQALKISNKDAVETALAWGARYIGVSATTDTIYLAGYIAGAIKSRAPEVTMIIGGPHVTAVPEKTLRLFPSFDLAVIGEGEETLKELIAAIESGTDLSGVRGILYRAGDRLVSTQPREFISDLDLLPLPSWDLLPDLAAHYRPTIVNYKSLPSTSLVTSRGCPGRCAFCDTRVFGSKYRVHSAGYVLDSIRYLKERYGIKDICFYDDVFTVFKDRLAEICDGLREKDARVDWSCQARVNTVDYEMMKMMKKAGCWKISFGIETGSDEILRLMNKNTTVERAKKAVSDASRAGLEVQGYFIMGFFGETRETLAMTRDFIMHSDLDIILSSYFLPFPGSPAYLDINRYGQFKEDWKNMNAFDSDVPQFIPNGLDAQEMAAFQKKLYRDFYFRPKVFAKYAWRMVKNPAYALKLARASLNLTKYIFKAYSGGSMQ